MRTSGILMPIFSLPSKYGIGTLGREAYRFVDFLEKSGQKWWQVLPVGPTGFGDSPYQSFSVCAGNPYFVDLDMLCEKKWLERDEIEKLDWGESQTQVDYALMYVNRFKVLRCAYKRFIAEAPREYSVFCRYHDWWLDDYAFYMAIKDSLGGCSVDRWEKKLRLREGEALEQKRAELSEDIEFYKTVQFWFYKQWKALKTYANRKGIEIIGDIPIYTSGDSADVWANPELFQLDEDLTPKAVAGCPPDAFSEDGQLWGNPLYDWERMKKDGYKWWMARIRQAFTLFDRVRIDHFRAFSAYYSIPYGDETAVNGKWVKGPGIEFFDTVKEQLGDLAIIAEDLGTLDEDVHTLLKQTGFPGMKVLQFAFDPESESSYLPHNIEKNCVVYSGTHDNDTAVGFSRDGEKEQVDYAREYLRIDEDASFNWSMIKAVMATGGDTVILQMQDFLGLDNTARINTPSVPSGNWNWRIEYSCINDWLAQIIYKTTDIYRRIPKKAKKETEKKV